MVLRKKIEFMNIKIDNVTMKEAIEEIDRLVKLKKPSYVVTPNVDHIVRIEKDKDFKKAYAEADLTLTDGKPLLWISKLIGNPIVEKISGSDLFPEICELAKEKGYRLFLLGAARGVAEKCKTNLMEKYELINIVGVYSPSYGFETDIVEINRIISEVKKAGPDILIVGLGAPKQELFINKYLMDMEVPLSLGLGATIDFEAGVVKRCPRWMSECGLEWAFRLWKEPRRMYKRYLIEDMKIIPLLFKYLKKVYFS